MAECIDIDVTVKGIAHFMAPGPTVENLWYQLETRVYLIDGRAHAQRRDTVFGRPMGEWELIDEDSPGYARTSLCMTAIEIWLDNVDVDGYPRRLVPEEDLA